MSARATLPSGLLPVLLWAVVSSSVGLGCANGTDAPVAPGKIGFPGAVPAGAPPVAATVFFSHDAHRGVAICGQCHGGGGGATAGHAECRLCHDIGAGDLTGPGVPLPATGCAGCHMGPPASTWPGRREGAGVYDFTHDDHASFRCGDPSCHPGVEKAAALGPPTAVVMERCIDCHDERRAVTDCAGCHDGIRIDLAPADHTAGILVAHEVRVAEEARCIRCHGEEPGGTGGCVDCHTTNRPRSHTPLFVTVQHGMEAAMGRDSCATCHEASECSSCHESVVPLDHFQTLFREGGHGAAARLKPRACITCHDFADDCGVCHGG